MMNKVAILQTAVCKMEDGLYVFESPLLPDCIGAAETEKGAWEHFSHHVDTAYSAYLEGRLAGMYERPGRPAKNRASLTLRVQANTKSAIARLAKEKDCSQGEIADYLFAFWESKQPRKVTKRKNARAAGKAASIGRTQAERRA